MFKHLKNLFNREEKQFSKGEAENFSNILRDASNSRGENKATLEAENLRLNNKLVEETISRFKKEFSYNLLYILIGFALGLSPTLWSKDKMTEVVVMLSKSISEKNASEIHYQTESRKMRSELSSLKKEILNLKSEMKVLNER